MTLKKHTDSVRGIAAIALLIASTCLFFLPILMIGLLKLIPIQSWRLRCSRLIDANVNLWCGINNTYIRQTNPIEFSVTGIELLDRRRTYLLIANHQSWLDIVILQFLFNRRIPTLKFFIKDQLKWVPLLGFAWWAMGCPFMKRYSRSYLAKNPHKKGQDLAATRKAVTAFRQQPAAIVNFVEGTRFNSSKKDLLKSPLRHLLLPRAGGISFVINALGSQLHKLLDVTIVYDVDNPSLWDFLCHRIPRMTVVVRELTIPPAFFAADFLENEVSTSEFKNWINDQWRFKDQLIENIKNQWVNEKDSGQPVALKVIADKIANTKQ